MGQHTQNYGFVVFMKVVNCFGSIGQKVEIQINSMHLVNIEFKFGTHYGKLFISSSVFMIEKENTTQCNISFEG